MTVMILNRYSIYKLTLFHSYVEIQDGFMAILRASASFPRWLEPVEEMWHIPKESSIMLSIVSSFLAAHASLLLPTLDFLSQHLVGCSSSGSTTIFKHHVCIYIYVYQFVAKKKDNPWKKEKTQYITITICLRILFFILQSLSKNQVVPLGRPRHPRLFSRGHKNSTTGPPHMEASVWDLLMDLASWSVWIHGKVGYPRLGSMEDIPSGYVNRLRTGKWPYK